MHQFWTIVRKIWQSLASLLWYYWYSVALYTGYLVAEKLYLEN